MNIIEPSYEILTKINGKQVLQHIYKQYKNLGGSIFWSEFKRNDNFEKISHAIETGDIGEVL